jgi:hypothetical protein
MGIEFGYFSTEIVKQNTSAIMGEEMLTAFTRV